MSERPIEEIYKAVSEGECDKIRRLVSEAINQGLNPLDVIEKGITKALKVIGEMFESGEVFLPELVMAGESAKIAVEILRPEFEKTKTQPKYLGKFIIGTVKGDIHDIGKNIVAAMLTANGFEVIDLGVDVPPEVFVEKVKESSAQIVGLSALVTTTIIGQKHVIEALERAGIRNKVKVIIGGAPVTEKWAKEIGADAYATDASEAVEKVKSLIG